MSYHLHCRGVQSEQDKHDDKPEKAEKQEQPYDLYDVAPDTADKNDKNDDRKSSVVAGVCRSLLLVVDVAAVAAQVSGALLWCLLHYLDYNQQYIKPHPYPWAVPGKYNEKYFSL